MNYSDLASFVANNRQVTGNTKKHMWLEFLIYRYSLCKFTIAGIYLGARLLLSYNNFTWVSYLSRDTNPCHFIYTVNLENFAMQAELGREFFAFLEWKETEESRDKL